ncbi:MAG: hypothetical protein AB1483_05295 [Candidatus Zixiibacteriota bacterium]
MSLLKFRAFMSCSRAPEDKSIVEFFRSYCESFGFEVLIYDWQEPVPLDDGVKSQITSADCVIAVATRKDRLDSGEWFCSDWIQHEVVFASAICKPVVIFAEQGVKVGGLLDRHERYQPFSREPMELLKQTPYFNKFLMALTRQLESQAVYVDDPSPSVYLKSIKSRDELVSRDIWTTTCEIELQSLVNGLSQSDEGFGDVDWLRFPYEAIRDIEFSVLQAPQGTNMRLDHERSKEDPNVWRVLYEPPLQIGQQVQYAYRYVAERIRPYTLEEAQAAMEAKESWCDSPQCTVNWDMLVSTGHLISEVVFPPKYKIHNPECLVETLDTHQPVISELDRIREVDGFKIQRFYDKYTLVLSVPKPRIGLRYMLTWRPPSEAELER